MKKVLRTIIYDLYGLIFIGTVFLMLGRQYVANVFTGKEFVLENAGFLILSLLIIVLVLFINNKYGNKLEEFFAKNSTILLLVSLGFLLFWQLYTCYGGYFYSGWDARVIFQTVLTEVAGDYSHLNTEYFSWFPNNLLIIWLFTAVTRLATACGFHNAEFAPVIFQCILDIFTVWLVYRITYGFTGSHRMAWAAYAVTYLFVGISPWFIVAYTDATGIIFPVLLIRIYQLLLEKESKSVKIIWSFMLGLIAITAYHIKPQTVIPLIAIALIELISAFDKKFIKNIITILPYIGGCIVGILIALMIYHLCIVPSTHIVTDQDKTIGWQHYIMMGLNDQTDGVYSGDDYAMTQSYETNAERNAADMEEAKKRIHDYGFVGMVRHLYRKQLVNYGDGTFAWNVEGNSFAGDPEWAHNSISGFIRSYIKPDGKNYEKFISCKQLMWVSIIFFQIFVPFYLQKDIYDNKDKMIMVMVTSIIGLTIFELLFEARARYLFCFAPIYVILGCVGLNNFYSYIKHH